jgi:hypothetical protein
MIELPEDDDALAAELASVLRARDAMPTSVANAARGAFAWRTVDADLAVLSMDSLLEATAGVRGGGGSGDRQLTFEARDLSLEVDVVEGGRRVVGQVVPPQQGHVELEGPHTSSTAATDAHGQFSLSVWNGPARLRFRPETGAPVVTDWVTL